MNDLLSDDEATAENERTDTASFSTNTDYTQLDVFERLQKTTTQAFAVKHSGTMFPDVTPYEGSTVAHNISTASKREESKVYHSDWTHRREESTRGAQSNYTQQDVFERLQKTTTEAYAKKTNRTKREP